MNKIDLRKYIGIPFKDNESSFNSCDCFGLVRLFYKTEFNIDIPNPSVSCFNSKKVFYKYLEEVSNNWNKIEEPINFCAIGIRNDFNHPSITQHFGIFFDNKILHTLDKVGSHIVPIKNYKNQISGYYEYNGKISNIS